MSEGFETEGDWNRGARRPGDTPNNLEFGPEFARYGRDVRAQVASRERSEGVIAHAAQADHQSGVAGARQRIGGAVGATVQIRDLARGWLIADGKGVEAACETEASAIEVLTAWLLEVEGRPGDGLRPRGSPVEVGRRPDGRQCLSIRRLANGWIVTDFVALEMLALDARGAMEIARDWISTRPASRHG